MTHRTKKNTHTHAVGNAAGCTVATLEKAANAVAKPGCTEHVVHLSREESPCLLLVWRRVLQEVQLGRLVQGGQHEPLGVPVDLRAEERTICL
jgi:hypothetical protein